MSSATPNPHDTYVDGIVERLNQHQVHDSHGKPIEGLTDLEKGVMLQFLLQMVAIGSGVTRIPLSLPASVRKHVVLFGCLLPLIEADAQRSGRNLVYLASTGNAEAGAKLEFNAMFPFTLNTRMEFNTWEALQPRPENGFKTIDLKSFWIIGDLDLDPAPQSLSGVFATRSAAVQRVLRDGACPVLMIHQEKYESLVGFPPSFSSKAAKGGCFIATAACGSPYAPEVDLLRGFRDQVLAPSAPGRAFIRLYERFSPPLANWIAGKPAMRTAVRKLLIRPLARILGR